MWVEHLVNISCCEGKRDIYSKPFKVHVDTSGLGLGAVLYQTHGDGPDRVISYISRTLSKSERKYPTHKLEFLVLKWPVNE